MISMRDMAKLKKILDRISKIRFRPKKRDKISIKMKVINSNITTIKDNQMSNHYFLFEIFFLNRYLIYKHRMSNLKPNQNDKLDLPLNQQKIQEELMGTMKNDFMDSFTEEEINGGNNE